MPAYVVEEDITPMDLKLLLGVTKYKSWDPNSSPLQEQEAPQLLSHLPPRQTESQCLILAVLKLTM